MTRRKESSAQSDLTNAVVDHFRGHERVVSASSETLASSAAAAGGAIIEALEGGGKVICFGNGGSATQASHLAQELVGRFRALRRPHPAVSLASDGATITCIGNDFGYSAVFDRQMAAFAQPGDIAIGLTTSGKSENVISAFAVARAKGAVTVALTGSAGLVGGETDHLIAVPSTDSAHIQEVHLMVLHAWCAAIDKALP